MESVSNVEKKWRTRQEKDEFKCGSQEKLVQHKKARCLFTSGFFYLIISISFYLTNETCPIKEWSFPRES